MSSIEGLSPLLSLFLSLASHRISLFPLLASHPQLLRDKEGKEKKKKKKPNNMCMLVSDDLSAFGVLCNTHADFSTASHLRFIHPQAAPTPPLRWGQAPIPFHTQVAGWRRTNFARWGPEAGLRTP